MFSALLRVSTSPAFFTADTSVDRAGLLDAAVATGSWAMPSKEPAPLLGTDEQAGPNGSSIGDALLPMPLSAAVAEDFDAESAFAEPSLLSLQALNASGSTAAAARTTAV